MNFKNIIVGLILVIVLGIIASNTFSISGFTTTGINEIDFKSSDSILNGKVWVVSIVQGGMSQSIYGAANEQDSVDGQERTVKPFSLDITQSNQYLEYPITIDYNNMPISQLGYMEESAIYSFAHTRLACLSYAGGDYSNILYVFRPGGSLNNMCVYRVPQTSNIATFNNVALTFNTNFKLGIGGKYYTKSISTTQRDTNSISSMVKFTDQTYGDVAYITWLGNLVSGEQPPTPSGQYVAAFFNSKWNIISKPRYDTYANNYIADISRITTYTTKDDIIAKIAKSNGLATTAKSVQIFKNINGEVAITEGTLGSGKVIITLNHALQYPTYVAYISADSVKGIGVYQPVATPKLVSVSDIVFKTGETGYVDVRIQNIGQERGGFTTEITCTNQVTMVGVQKYNTLLAGEAISLTIPVTGQTTTDSVCTATTSVLGTSDSKTFSATVSAQQICKPDGQICLNGVSSVCKSDGSGYEEDGDDKRCIAQGGDGGGGGTGGTGSALLDAIIKALFGGTSPLNTILTVILVVIFSAVGLLMFYGILKAVILKKLT